MKSLAARISQTSLFVVCLLTTAVAGEHCKSSGNKRVVNSIGMTLHLIPAGEFQMGSPGIEPGRGDDELLHRVRISRPFYIGAHEVTQAEYQRVMGINPSQFSETGGFASRVKGIDTADFPVDSVSWSDAVEFCSKLSTLPDECKSGRRYRLPTEAEWEYACRGGTSGLWSFGDDPKLLAKHAWYRNGEQRTHAVGKKPANSFGLFDMHGNVWEWCQDWHDEKFYESSPRCDPSGPSSDDPASDNPASWTSRVIRGGGWLSGPANCRSACRFHDPPSTRDPDLGFRVVLIP